MSVRIGAYSRISLDWEGEGLGVARQRSDSQKLAALRDWDITEFYTDNNISAFKSDVQRPEFERMLLDLSNGQLDGIIAYDLDRIARQPVDLERIIRIYEQRPGLLFATVQGSINLSTSDGLTMARVMVTFANKSSMDTSRRTKRKNLERAEAGLSHGGHRPYGYEADFVTLHPTEAPVLHQMGMKLLAGESYRDIAYWMNEQGQATTTGKLWYAITVRNTLRRPRYAGVRVHLGIEYPGTWEPIFSRDEWDAIQYTIKTRREKAGSKPVAKKYLLTGILTCGKCGGFLNGETKRDHPDRPLRRTYQCRVHGDTQKQGGCGGVTRNADALEHFIREVVCFRLDTPDLAELLNPEGETGSTIHELLNQRERVVQRKTALLDDYTDGIILSKADYTRAQSRLEAQLGAFDRDLDELRRKNLNVSVNAGETVKEAWLARSDSWRREVIGTVINSVSVNVGKTKPYYDVDGKRARFDPSLIEIDWRV